MLTFFCSIGYVALNVKGTCSKFTDFTSLRQNAFEAEGHNMNGPPVSRPLLLIVLVIPLVGL